MSFYTPSETLHRLVKEALDSGAAATLKEAEVLFHQYELVFHIDSAQADDVFSQAALLTGVALARRVFLGGVTVVGFLEVPLLVPLPLGETLGGAVSLLGGITAEEIPLGRPVVSIGGGPQQCTGAFHIRTAYSGWRGGILPIDDPTQLASSPTMPLAAMLSAALAVNEAFLYARRETPIAGRRVIGLSLWNLENKSSWWEEAPNEPALSILPSRLWLIGLGHLGQAYLWALGLLPYGESAELELVLQDVDEITPSTESTSILSDSTMLGQKKTRAMAAWAERRGFSTKICERLFDEFFERHETEPCVALCGLDNALGRRALDKVGFELIVEAGLGRGYRDFRTMRIHTLPARRTASEMWGEMDTHEDVSNRSAYARLREDGVLDKCGTTLLAGKAVGAPFVGAVAACLVVAQVLRLLHGGKIDQVIDLDLQDLMFRSVVPQSRTFDTLNPGFVAARFEPCTDHDPASQPFLEVAV